MFDIVPTPAALFDRFCHVLEYSEISARALVPRLSPRLSPQLTRTTTAPLHAQIALFERCGFVAKALSTQFAANAARTATTTLVLLERPNVGHTLVYAAGAGGADLPARAADAARWDSVDVDISTYDDGGAAREGDDASAALLEAGMRESPPAATHRELVALEPATATAAVSGAAVAAAGGEASANSESASNPLRLVWWELGRQEKRMEAVATAAAEAAAASAAQLREHEAQLAAAHEAIAELRAELGAARQERGALRAERDAQRDREYAALAPLRAELAAARLAATMLGARGDAC